MNFKKLAIAMGVVTALASCSTPRSPLPYFTDIESVIKEGQTIDANDFLVKIQPDDELFISVMSDNPEATTLYNLPLTNPAESSSLVKTTSPQQQTYIVNSNGDIKMPIIGTLHVAGLTVEQLQDMLTKKISVDVENPLVRVQLISFRVNVAGEVKNPGRIGVARNRFSVLDAITAAGDLTEYGERENVLLIREENGVRTFHRFNLNSADIFDSPYFYLKQNDYIYIEPNRIREENSKYNTNNAYKLSVISTTVSAASVIVSLIIALSLK